MSPNINGPDEISLQIENYSEIAFNLHRKNRLPKSCGKLADFMDAQSGVERIFFEDFPGVAGGFFLVGIRPVQVLPKCFRSLKPHVRSGGFLCNAVSMSPVPPSSWSSTRHDTDTG